MDIDLNLLKTFIKVAELGSFTAAAQALKQPKSRVSRAIARLESEMDLQLIRRTTRKTSLTSSGQEFFRSILPLISGIRTEIEKFSEQQQEMSGEIRLTASQDIGQTLVVQLISEFNARFPKVSFNTTITNDFLDLTKENIDIAFRVGRLSDSSLIQKKLMSASFLLVCSSSYLDTHPFPSEIADLGEHRFLSFRGIESNLPSKEFSITPVLTSDSIPMLLNMVLSGEGIAALPDFFCKEHLMSKKLIHVIPSWRTKSKNIQMLYVPNKNLSKKIRAFIQFASDMCMNQDPGT